MKLLIDRDEIYPAYSVLAPDSEWGTEIDVTPEQAADWQRVLAEWSRVQGEMAAAWER